MKTIPTLPGSMVPTEGDIVMGASSGSTNSKDVGPTGAISPKMQTKALVLVLFFYNCINLKLFSSIFKNV